MPQPRSDRLEAQLTFLRELDQLKSIERANPLADGSRRENSAEHSWHVAVIAMVLAERAAPGLDVGRVVLMCLLHDIVEIDAGDTPPWDSAGRATKVERETAAADRIFALLPADQADAFRGAWDEFEAASTGEARLARAADQLAALLLNHAAGGTLWREHGRTVQDVRTRNARVGEWVPDLAEVVSALVDDAEARGLFS